MELKTGRMTMNTTPNLVVFGESFVDAGNLFDATEGLLFDQARDGLGGALNRFTDGIVYAEYLEQLGLYETTYNYAIAGAKAVGEMTLFELLAPVVPVEGFSAPIDDPGFQFDVNIAAQVDRFLADMAGQSLADFTAHIEIGGNDYRLLTVINPNNAVEALNVQVDLVVADILATIEALAQAGVGHVEISSLIPIQYSPLGSGFTEDQLEGWDYVVERHNEALQAGLEQLDYPGVTFELLDVNPLYAAAADDPESFGFVAPAAAYMTDEATAPLETYDADQIMYYDEVHVSTAMHGVHAAYIAAAGEKDLVAGTENGDFALSYAAEGALVFAGAGIDFALTDLGDDIVFAGSSDDFAVTGAGNDLTSGGSGNDKLITGDGNDIVDGDSGDDLLLAGAGDDLLIDGLGSDIALGGDGADSFIFTQAELIGGITGDDTDILVGGAGIDTLYLVLDEATAFNFGAFVSASELSSLGITAYGIENIVVLAGRDSLSDLSSEAWYDDANIWGLV